VLFSGDCVTIKGGILPVTLVNGEAKIFVPQTGEGSFPQEMHFTPPNMGTNTSIDSIDSTESSSSSSNEDGFINM